MNDTGIIILAAGSSSRLGSTKQLLYYKGKSLLAHTVDEALEAKLHPIIVVTGADATQVSQAIKNEQATTVHNESWQQGMASGILCGLHAITSSHTEIKQVIIAVCDQPFISATLFQQLIYKQAESNRGIIACAYADTTGTPVLFSQRYFNELAGLQGDEGAKKLLITYRDDVATIDFPQGKIDIDTKEDYRQLLGS